MKNIKTYIENFTYAAKIIFKISPFSYTVCLMLRFISDILTIWFEAYFISNVLALLSRHAKWQEIVLYCLLAMVVILAKTISFEFYNLIKMKADFECRKAIQTQVYQASLKRTLNDFHTPDFFNEYSYVIEHASGYIIKSLDHIYIIFISMVYAVIFTKELIGLNTEILLTALVLMVFKFVADYFLSAKHNDIKYENELAMQPFNRKEAYFTRLFFEKKNAYDMKNPYLSDLLRNEYLDSADASVEQQIKSNKRLFPISFIQTLYNNTFTSIFVVLVLVYVLKHTGVNDVSIYWRINALFLTMFGLGLLQLPSNIREYSKYINKIRIFLDKKKDYDCLKIDCTKIPHLLIKEISFSYDRSSTFSLKNISMNIEAGQTIAIVGKNGSGKTTLLNLMLGLLNPTTGEITMDGINLSDLNLIENQYVSLLSQNFNIYYATIRDNVTMGKDGFSDDEILKALHLAECDEFFSQFENGLDTKIGKQFEDNAIELSGGQAQRIALARVFLSNAPLVFLDEPTAAIDPVFEMTILDNLKKKFVR